MVNNLAVREIIKATWD